MENLSSWAHPGTIPHSPSSGKITLFIKHLFYIPVLLTVSVPEHSNPIQCGVKGKGIPFFTSRYNPVGISSMGSIFRKGFFSQVLRIFFFHWDFGQKSRNIKKNGNTNKTNKPPSPLRSHTSNLLLAHFCIQVCQVSSAWLRKSYTISLTPPKSEENVNSFFWHEKDQRN